VTDATTLEPLLIVQARRLEQAMAHIKQCNEVLRVKKRAYDAARERWSSADSERREFKHAQAQAVSDHLMRGVTAVDFVTTSVRSEWLRARVAELFGQLQAAQAELKPAEEAAAAAQALYRRELAKRDALNKLAAEAQRTRTQKTWRVEEYETDDRVAYGHANSR
jgi:chromosome segregation ATPase